LLTTLFGDMADEICLTVFRFFGGKCKKFERKSE
jgi:hypothetical protein